MLSKAAFPVVPVRGARLLRALPPSERRFLEDVVECMEDDVPGREPTEGGCGKAPMLIVLRKVFPCTCALPKAESVLKVGMSDVELTCCGDGR